MLRRSGRSKRSFKCWYAKGKAIPNFLHKAETSSSTQHGSRCALTFWAAAPQVRLARRVAMNILEKLLKSIGAPVCITALELSAPIAR